MYRKYYWNSQCLNYGCGACPQLLTVLCASLQTEEVTWCVYLCACVCDRLRTHSDFDVGPLPQPLLTRFGRGELRHLLPIQLKNAGTLVPHHLNMKQEQKLEQCSGKRLQDILIMKLKECKSKLTVA